MATTFVIACPECSKQVRVSDEHVGKKIRCKGCGNVFPVAADGAGAPKTQAAPGAAKTQAAAGGPKTKAAPPSPPPRPEDDPEYDPNKYILAQVNDTLPRCPFCAKEMPSVEALICLHCGYNTRTRERPHVKQVYAHTPAELILWWLPAIFTILFIAGMWVWYYFFWDLIEEWLAESWFEDEPGPPRTYLAGLSPGMFRLYHALFIVFAMVPLVRFIWKRLVTHNKPPEKKIKDEWSMLGEG
jgi:predicted Zn finger-like uncharacterized protein